MTSRVLPALTCAFLLAACGGASDPKPVALTPAPTAAQSATAEAPAAETDRFDADRAWSMLDYQVKLGPRPAGSAKSRQLAAYIKQRLPDAHYETLPGGLRNVVGKLPGKGKPVVLAAHYDTKDVPDFVGANDGAGGTAAMLEIARVLRKTKRAKDAPPIWFVAFDGEEATDDSDFYGSGLRGSKPFAKRYASKIKELVLLDFIANKNLAIPYEHSSNAEMWADLREAAERVGSDSAFPDVRQGVVEDDHTPFVRRGVPAIDLIDFKFPCWHKPCDDLAAVSESSLDKSGEAVLEFLRRR
jgi:glutaminyl-peptide cyclotransferase